MTSIVTPGDAPNAGGKPMTGVSGPSGCVRSTTFNRPEASSSTSCVSVDGMGRLRRGRSAAVRQVALKLKPVLEQREPRHVARRAHRVDFRDDRREIARGIRRGKLAGELV